MDVAVRDRTDVGAMTDRRFTATRRVQPAVVVLFLAAALVVIVSISGIGNVASADPSASDWQRLRQCESGDDYTIDTGNGYYGAYQFDLATWQSLGGTGYPNEASPETQDAMALKLWQERGWSPWACASIIGLTAPKPVPPVGVVDSVQNYGTSATVTGWTYDPASPGTSIDVHFYVNNAGHAYPANKPRPDVNSAFGITGQHGFSQNIPLAPGANSICVFGIGTSENDNTLLYCGVEQGLQPVSGVVDAMVVSGLTTTVVGWTVDSDSSDTSIPVHVEANGETTAATANLPRPDVDNALGVTGQHGFSVKVPVKSGPNRVCAFGIGTSGNKTLLQCRTVQGAVPPVGVVDSMTISGSSAIVSGWDDDPNSSGTSIAVHMYVNGVGYGYTADKPRPDVNAALGITGQHGFSETVPLRQGSNSVCVFAIGVGESNNTLLQCRDLQLNGPQAMAMAAAAAADAAAVGAPSVPSSVPSAPSESSVPTWSSGSPASSQPPPTAAIAPSSVLPLGSSSAPTMQSSVAASSVPSSQPPSSHPPSATATSTATSTIAPSYPPQNSAPQNSAPQSTPPSPSGPPPVTSSGSSGAPSTLLSTPAAPPLAKGAVESVAVNGSTGTVTGWFADGIARPDGTRVRITVNGVAHDVLATLARPDISAAAAGLTPVGFVEQLTLSRGRNDVCLDEIDKAGEVSTAPISCRTEFVH